MGEDVHKISQMGEVQGPVRSSHPSNSFLLVQADFL